MNNSGLSAMIQLGALLENEFDGIEVIEIGRAATAREADFAMQVCGPFLFYTVTLRAGGIYLAAQPMDTGDAPALLLRARDDASGWDTIKRLVSALEVNQFKTLWPRPLQVGPIGADGWIIG